MRRIARTALAAAAVVAFTGPALIAGTSGTAAAELGAAGPTFVPFSQMLRRCDFSKYQYVGGSYYGHPTAQMRIEGGQVVADIQLSSGTRNTRYDVKLVQVPRSSASSCNAGEPGVAVSSLTTDAGGAGTTTVRGPITSGATGVWAYITRPSAFSQMPEEFYSSDMIVDF